MKQIAWLILLLLPVVGFSKQNEFLLREIQTKSLSHVEIGNGKNGITVYLYAANQQTEVVKEQGNDCKFPPEGKKIYRGNFELVSVKKGKIKSTLPLKDHWFAEGKKYDGLYVTGIEDHNFVTIYQFDGCHAQRMAMFRVGNDGKLHQALFKDKKRKYIDLKYTVEPQFAKKSVHSCLLHEDAQKYFCESYKFNGKNFEFKDAWITEKPM